MKLHLVTIKFSNAASPVLRGIGQIMLQNSTVTGTLLLLGICYGSITMGIAALLGASFGTATARLLKIPRTLINDGLFGFNAALTGVALILYFKPGLTLWGLIIVGAAVSSLIQCLFVKYKLALYTLPFVLTTWILLLATNYFFPGAQLQPALPEIQHGESFEFIIRGYGQVIFQNSLIAGVLFFVGVFFNAPIAALYGVVGGVLAAVISYYFDAQPQDIANGIFSFNAVLCAIALSGEKVIDGFWVLCACILSLCCSLILYRIGIPQLTFPFVAATVAVSSVKDFVNTRTNVGHL